MVFVAHGSARRLSALILHFEHWHPTAVFNVNEQEIYHYGIQRQLHVDDYISCCGFPRCLTEAAVRRAARVAPPGNSYDCLLLIFGLLIPPIRVSPLCLPLA